MSKRKKILSEYCRGCLSKDRPLISIVNHYRIFLKLMDGEIDNIGQQVDIPKMCWECRAVLRNSERFLQNVKKAHNFLTGVGKKTVEIRCLSNLHNVIKNYYDVQDIHEDFINDIDVRHNITNEINIVHEDFTTDLNPQDAPDDMDMEIELKKEENITDDEPFDGYEDLKEENVIDDIKPMVPTKNERDLVQWMKREKIRAREEEMETSKSKFKVICLSQEIDNRTSSKKVVIDDKEMYHWLEKDKNARNYRTMPFKCELCTTGYASMEYYNRHVARFHLKSSGEFECHICKKRFKDKKDLTCHIRKHYTKYVCLLCNYENYRAWKMDAHLQTHRRAVECLSCGLHFGGHHDFHEHYRNMHSKVVCDYCGKKCSKKHQLIKHIKFRHSNHKCKFCDKTYMSFDAMVNHARLQHVVTRSEECYCVECNIQFDNVSRYTVHLKTSVKHKKYVGVPCPVCNKVYHKRYSMNNHYRLVHLKQTPYHCEKCSKYFLNSYRLRLHKERIHEKIAAVKDKICPHCERAFSTNRILLNHIRTHTGERPFVCDICSAKFTQKTPLLVHRRSVHKIQK